MIQLATGGADVDAVVTRSMNFLQAYGDAFDFALSSDPGVFPQYPQKQMLRLDVVRAALRRLVARKKDRPTRLLCVSFEHECVSVTSLYPFPA